MGLHHTAHYLKSKGRGNDTMLVHMTPNEVKGLQALAMAKGGSLTINPQTGLPEAGFLEDILPVVAAAGLTYLTAGAAAPALATALGPAAAGGAGLLSAGAASTVGGIAAGALSGAAISGLTAAVTGKDAGQAALMGGLGGGIAGGMGAYSGDPSQLFTTSQQIATSTPEVGSQIAQKTAEGVAQAPGITATGLPAAPPSFPTVNPAGYGMSIPDPNLPGGFISSETGTQLATAPASSGFTTGEMMAGSVRPGPVPPVSQAEAAQAARTIGGAGSVTGTAPTTFYQDQGTIGRAAIQSLPGLGLLGGTTPQTGPQDNYVSPLQRLSPNFQAYVPPQPNPYYRAQYPVYGAEGGEVKRYQVGGPVERMSQMNTAMNPQGGLYPQGMIDKTQYATPTQRPVSSEMVMEDSAYERSNPMLMASGGEVKGYAAGGMPDFGNGYNPFANLPPMSGPLGAVGGQRPIGMQPMGVSYGINPFSPERMAVLRNDPKFLEMQRVQGGGYDAQGRPVDGLGNLINQPTGQSTFPGATSMQSGFGQGAPGYPSLTMGSGGSGGFSGGTSGAFPLEGRYGIVKMNVGGVARPLPKGDAGIYRDTDPTTRNQDAFTASLTRLGGMQKKANIKGLPVLRAAAAPLGNIEEAAGGGIMSSLGSYSDGGRMLKGPGDGMSDSIPGVIGGKQPARLADGEFVVPADVVSHLGNGSTDAGARKLYKMMDKIRSARTGKKKQAPAVKAEKYMPA